MRADMEGLRAALDSPHDDDDLLYSTLLPEPSGNWATPTLLPTFTDRAADLVIETIGISAPGHRRDLALARTARAVAMIGGANAVSEEHVSTAAALLGIAKQHVDARDQPVEPDTQPDHLASAEDTTSTVPVPAGQSNLDPDAKGDDEQLLTALEGTEAPADPTDPNWTFPEDHPSALPDYASLRMPWQSRLQVRHQRGSITGTEPTTKLIDLAVVATAMEAAKFQPMRRRLTGHQGPTLLIGSSDLRRHRRQSGPDTAVVILLDHTCRKNWDWSEALAPYLRWAHIQRSAVTVIEFGHATNPNELRAEKYRVIGAADNRIADSLQRPAGRATPLAYALDVAVQELRKRTRGQASTERAWLVVASDGRGNIPLEASLRGQVGMPIAREGIDDALHIAARVRALPAVQPVVLAPPDLAYYSHLPFELADAMAGIVAATEAT